MCWHHVVSTSFTLGTIQTLTLPSACLPTLRLLLVKLFPILGGSSVRSRQQYHNYGSGTDLKTLSRGTKSRKVNTTVSRSSFAPTSNDNGDMEGITIKTSYTVQNSRADTDTDEASLVSHKSKVGL